MSDESDETGEQIAEIAESIQGGIETGTQVAEEIERMANGEPGAPATPGGIVNGLGAGLDVAGDALGALGADSRLVQGIEALADIVPLMGTAIEAVEALVDSARAVDKAFRSEQRRVEYDIALEGLSGWKVSEVALTESIGRPYLARIHIRTEQRDASPKDLLGIEATLTIRRGEDDVTRRVHGRIARVERGEENERHLLAVIEIVPALSLLRHVRDSRIFQDLSVTQIIDAAIGAYLADYQREIRIEVEREEHYLRREYCVQYQETVLDFFHRLLEDEGLTYYFDHSGARETVVVVDDNAAFPRAPLMPEAEGSPFIPSVTGNTVVREEPIRELIAAELVGPTSLTVADFDWTAEVLPFSREQRTTDAHQHGREEYVHDRATVITGYDKNSRKYQSFDVERRIDRGRELQAMGAHELRGRGEVVGLSAGSVLQVVDHPNGLDGEYLITRVTHAGHDHNLGDDAARTVRGQPEYENVFYCIPLEVQYRPPQVTRCPRIHGIQTATVVGPREEEIWVDEHGRVRIQFHWDRRGRNDEESTCWVRVMQSWAGPGFGTLFTPRIGMEVVVSFIDGDPDRPIVTGCVYNGHNFPPVALPEGKTQSTLRTQSSPSNDGGFNELRFEDKAGEEEVRLHAQRDLVEEVLRDRSRSVGGSETVTVDGAQTVSVGGAQTITVTGEREVHVEDAERHLVDKTRDVRVTEHDTETYEGGRTITVQGEERLNVDGNAEIQVSEHHKIYNSGTQLYLDSEHLYVEASHHIKLKVGNTELYMDANGVTLTAPEVAVVVRGSQVMVKPQEIVLNTPGTMLGLRGSEGASLSAGEARSPPVARRSASTPHRSARSRPLPTRSSDRRFSSTETVSLSRRHHMPLTRYVLEWTDGLSELVRRPGPEIVLVRASTGTDRLASRLISRWSDAWDYPALFVGMDPSSREGLIASLRESLGAARDAILAVTSRDGLDLEIPTPRQEAAQQPADSMEAAARLARWMAPIGGPLVLAGRIPPTSRSSADLPWLEECLRYRTQLVRVILICPEGWTLSETETTPREVCEVPRSSPVEAVRYISAFLDDRRRAILVYDAPPRGADWLCRQIAGMGSHTRVDLRGARPDNVLMTTLRALDALDGAAGGAAGRALGYAMETLTAPRLVLAVAAATPADLAALASFLTELASHILDPRVKVFVVCEGLGARVRALAASARTFVEHPFRIDADLIQSGLSELVVDPARTERERTVGLCSLASFHSARGEHETALRYVAQCLERVRTLADPELRRHLGYAAANMIARAGQVPAALDMLAECITQAVAAGDARLAVRAAAAIGDTYFNCGRWLEARSCYGAASQLARSCCEHAVWMHCETWIGEALVRQGDLAAGTAVWRRLASDADRLGPAAQDQVRHARADVHERLSKLCASHGLHAPAREHHQAAVDHGYCGHLPTQPVG